MGNTPATCLEEHFLAICESSHIWYRYHPGLQWELSQAIEGNRQNQGKTVQLL